MIDKIVFGLAAVMIAEGLVYLLAPHALETLLKALKSLSISARRQMVLARCKKVADLHPPGKTKLFKGSSVLFISSISVSIISIWFVDTLNL